LLAQQSEGKADSTLGSRPAGWKAEAKVPVERRKLKKLVRAVELEKEPWFKKATREKGKYAQQDKRGRHSTGIHSITCPVPVVQ